MAGRQDVPAVDWSRFRALLRHAREVRPTDPAAAVAGLRAAVGLWPSPPSADLKPQYVGAVEELAELEVDNGQADAAAERLDHVVTAHPHRARAADLLVRALIEVGEAERLRGRYGQAATRFERALETARRTGNRPGEWHALAGLGYTHRVRGRYDRAEEHYGQSLDLVRLTGNQAAEHNCLYGLGHVHLAKGRHEQALEHFERALAVAGAADNGTAQFDSLDGFGRTYSDMGRYEKAQALHQAALSIATELWHPTNQARAHDGLAQAHRGEGNRERARRHWRAALDVLTAHGLDRTYDPQVTVGAIRANLVALDGHGAGPARRSQLHTKEDDANRGTH